MTNFIRIMIKTKLLNPEDIWKISKFYENIGIILKS